jgi:uncharacterized protein (DUF849 family)
MLVKACLNGSRPPGAHPALPVTPHELAREALAAVRAGAGALHLHPRRADGAEALDPEVQGAALRAVRAACAGIPVGISTGIWIEPDLNRRLALVRGWTLLPDFASVNFAEPGAADLCALLLARGIGVEAGLAAAADARLLGESGLAARCLRILLEPPEAAAAEAQVTATQIVRALDEWRIEDVPRLLHGSEAAAWPVLANALAWGYDTRIGLEDTLTMPDGTLARDNAALVSHSVLAARTAGHL